MNAFQRSSLVFFAFWSLHVSAAGLDTWPDPERRAWLLKKLPSVAAVSHDKKWDAYSTDLFLFRAAAARSPIEMKKLHDDYPVFSAKSLEKISHLAREALQGSP